MKGDDDDDTIAHLPPAHVPAWLKAERTRVLTSVSEPRTEVDGAGGCVVYWMQRDVRTVDNWALALAVHLAQHVCRVPLRVVTVLPSPAEERPRTTERHASFLLGGLEAVQQELADFHVPLDVLCPDGVTGGAVLHEFAVAHRARAVVGDFNPLRTYRRWAEEEAAPLLGKSNVPLYQVDAHNIVPVWVASNKREVGARTLRPKINRLLPDYLTHFPTLEQLFRDDPTNNECVLPDATQAVNWQSCRDFLNPDPAVPAVEWAQPGTAAAMVQFRSFQAGGLQHFDKLRNDPNNADVCSNLSPWINHGHVSFQRLALEVRAQKRHANGTAAFVEEGVVRRELSDNFVFYTPDHYDSLTGAAQWAQDSLELHRSDDREHRYTSQQLEDALTHDDLWNAAQLQLTTEGKMHGFLRMYWAKKILEWTETPATALSTAQYLNDRYNLDGNDPNGFVGVGWSIMGIHDMGWKERDIFGKIRYMNYAGCKRKFKVQNFVNKYPPASDNAAKVGGNISTSSSSTASKDETKKRARGAATTTNTTKKAPAKKRKVKT